MLLLMKTITVQSPLLRFASLHRTETTSRKTLVNESAPIQLAQCRFPGLAISNAKNINIFLQLKCTEAILSDNTRKLLLFEITKSLIAV